MGDGEIGSENYIQKRDSALSSTAPHLDGEDFGALISDAFEKHLPDPSILVQPAQVYAEQLTQAALDKLTPLTNLVRDSVEGVSEARLSLQDQSEVIRTSMTGLSEDLQQSLRELEPVLNKIAGSTRQARTNAEYLDQLEAMTDLRQSLEELNMNLSRLTPNRRFNWPWGKRGLG